MKIHLYLPCLVTLLSLVACGSPGATPVAPTVNSLPPTPSLPTPSLPTQTPPNAQPTTVVSGPGQMVLHQPSAIIIAYSGPETGSGRALFTPLQQASQMAIDDHGPIHGFGVNLIPFNDDCTRIGGQSVGQQIIADERIVAVLGPACSTAVRGAGPYLEDANIVMISGAATAVGLGAEAGPGVFHRTLLDDDVVASLGYTSQIYIQDLPSVQDWFTRFSATGGTPLEQGLKHYLPYQYDAAAVLLRALSQTAVLQADGSLLIDREALRAALRATMNYPGVTGTITFEADGDRAP